MNNDTILINGKVESDIILNQLKQEISVLYSKYSQRARLHVLLVGDNSASHLYVKNKANKANFIGIDAEVDILPSDISQNDLLERINTLNTDKAIHAILVQLPLPKHIDSNVIINAIDPNKDVDGFHPYNLGRLVSTIPNIIPCTPKGCLHLIKSIQNSLTGLNALVIGRSKIVGLPMAQLLLQENCTVTSAHIYSKNIKLHSRNADILVVATGNPHLVNKDWIKENSIIIDVGINYIKDENGDRKLAGDVDLQSVIGIARAITPVPGGVGPMTIASLMQNTLKLFKKSLKIK